MKSIRTACLMRLSGAVGVLLLLMAVFILWVNPARMHQRLLLTPLIGDLTPCIFGTALVAENVDDSIFQACSREDGSAQPVIESTLNRLGPKVSLDRRYELGYTLVVPVLSFLKSVENRWEIDQVALKRLMKTLRDTDRRVVLYLFSTHFSLPTPLEDLLAQDASNLAATVQGPLAKDKYYGMDVYPWSIARTDNAITALRMKVFTSISTALCEQAPEVRDRIVGISVLGETHHHFPGFEVGMGFDGRYRVSDYSNASVLAFRGFLRKRFRDISDLNLALGGSAFTDFEFVSPPSKDIRHDAMQDFSEHIDSYAAGQMPVEGWLAPDPHLTGWVQIFADGVLVGRTRASLGRQDVLSALPDIGTADVGWRYDLDFRQMATGVHQIAVFAEKVNRGFVSMGLREIKIQRRNGSDVFVSTNALPKVDVIQTRGSFDQPKDKATYFHNPLVELWTEFRRQQVVDYLTYLEQPLQATCLGTVPKYVHQLFPYPNSSWDASKYAVDASLRSVGDMQLGVSLYGEATYGDSFFSWKRDNRRGGYGVTEFHPLRAMDASELQSVLQRHQQNGARFISFFMEGTGSEPLKDTKLVKNFMSFDALNQQFGSDALYSSMHQLMVQP